MRDGLIILLIFAIISFSLPLISVQEAKAAAVFPEKITLLREKTGEIVTLSGKDYIKGCISAQIPIDYEQQALNAQAAAAATYALRLMADTRESEAPWGEADLSDSAAACQSYFDYEECIESYGEEYNEFLPKIEAAATFGLSHIITYEKEPIYAVYHSVNTGKTASPEIIWGRSFPYLKPVESPWDKSYINYECSNEMTTEEARRLLISHKSDIEIPADFGKWFSEINVNESGYVISLHLGKTLLSGGDMWRIFGLRSPAFEISYADNVFTFKTKGYGHGVGLSQYGANEMAKSGKNAEEILKYYYSGVEIS